MGFSGVTFLPIAARTAASILEFPGNRENNREFPNFRPSLRFLTSIFEAISVSSSQFPAQPKQGISNVEAGNSDSCVEFRRGGAGGFVPPKPREPRRTAL